MTFPRLFSGAVIQSGAERQREYRTVRHTDSYSRGWSDPGGPITKWRLPYVGLSRVEADVLEAFYVATEGPLQSFHFYDPFDNLLLWSEDFSRPPWQRDPYLAVLGGTTDPKGGSCATRLRNMGGGGQELWQQADVCSEYLSTFSIWLRTDGPQTVDLFRKTGAHRSLLRVEVGPSWQRYNLSGVGGGTSPDGAWGVMLTASQEVELFGAQLEAQVAPSRYIKSEGKAGIYREARFGDQPLTITAVDIDSYRCDITIEARR